MGKGLETAIEVVGKSLGAEPVSLLEWLRQTPCQTYSCRDAMNWRDKKFGRLSGGEIQSILLTFQQCWSERETCTEPLEGDSWFRSVERLMKIPSWTLFYQDSLLELIAKVVTVTGTGEALEEAIRQERVVDGILEAFEAVPNEPPDHPAAMPLAFAMLGNLDAIARYSRSINDMLKACREQGDLQALLDALSVDSTISTMPFFQAAMRLGQLTGDTSATEDVFSAIKGPHRKRLTYPELRWTEYLLRDQGAFETCSREEIYELVVVHLGIYDPSGTKKDPKAALFTLFRAWQKSAGIQNPRFGFSGIAK